MPSGSRKSSVFALTTRPLFAFERELGEDAAPEIAKRQTELAILEEELRLTKAKAARTEEPDKKLAFIDKAKKLSDELVQLPTIPHPRLLADDVTPEKVASLIAEQGGRMGIMSSEGGIFQTMAGRYSAHGEANLDVFLKGHSGDPVMVDRQDGRQTNIPHPALSIGLTIQPSVLHGLASGRKTEFRSRGLLGRFLYALPPSLLGHRDVRPASITPATSADYESHFRRLLQTDWATDSGGNRKPHVIGFNDTARDRLLEYASEVEALLAPGQALANMTDWGGKLVGAVVRLCGLLHSADGNNAATPIREVVVDRAIQLGRYFETHAKAAYSEIGSDPILGTGRTVCAWILRRKRRSFSQRDVHQAHRSLFKNSKDVVPVLELLTDHGFIRPKSTPKAGPGRKPSQEYDVNPEWGAQNTHNTQKELSGDQTTFDVPALNGGQQQTVSTRPHTRLPDRQVLEQAREYLIGHPDADRNAVVGYLGLAVPLGDANAAIDALCSDFPHLKKNRGQKSVMERADR